MDRTGGLSFDVACRPQKAASATVRLPDPHSRRRSPWRRTRADAASGSGAIAGVRCQRRRDSALCHRNRRRRRWCRRHSLGQGGHIRSLWLGGVIDEVAAGKLRAKVVRGAANNQLATTEDGDRLAERDILYAPDYVVNAGGIINVAAKYLGWPQADSNARVEATADRLADVFTHGKTHGVAPQTAADQLARQRIAKASLDAPDELAVAA